MADNSETLKKVRLPADGVWHLSQTPRFAEVIVFIHYYGGNRNTSKRHIEWVNRLGFHAVSFTLSFNRALLPERIPWNSHLEIGYLHVWKEEIENTLNHIPLAKIPFAFSNPAGAMLLAVAARGAHDVSAVVCDSGPFLNNFRLMVSTLLASEKHFSWKQKLAINLGSYFVFGGNYTEVARNALHSLRAHLPILSIRSWKDNLVPLASVEEYFALNPELNLQILTLTDSDHLEGLKVCPDEYMSKVGVFLQAHAHPI